MAAKGKIIIDRERCKGCRLCLEVCPGGNIGVDKNLNKLGYQPACYKDPAEAEKECTGCTLCAIARISIGVMPPLM